MELDSRSKIHLEWMFDNQPDLVRELLSKGKLEDLLEDKYQRALDLTLKLKAKGLSENEAFENATELILAPPDGPAMSDNPPEPMSLQERKQVYSRLDARELANRRRTGSRR